MSGATVISRMSASCLGRRRARLFLASTALACLVLAACSPGADYPSLFPAVHDIPPPRTDTPLDANQVQQATEDLITARDRLNTEAQSGQGKNAAAASGKPAANSSAKPSVKSSANPAGKSSAKAATDPAKKPVTQVSGREPRGDATQTVGAETK